MYPASLWSAINGDLHWVLADRPTGRIGSSWKKNMAAAAFGLSLLPRTRGFLPVFQADWWCMAFYHYVTRRTKEAKMRFLEKSCFFVPSMFGKRLSLQLGCKWKMFGLDISCSCKLFPRVSCRNFMYKIDDSILRVPNVQYINTLASNSLSQSNSPPTLFRL